MKCGLVLTVTEFLTGCGNATDTAADKSSAAGDSESLAPGKLLTGDRVATVLPEPDAGFALPDIVAERLN